MTGAHREYTRRRFVRLLGGGTFGSMGLIGGNLALAGKDATKPLVSQYGVCTSYENYPMLKQAGYGYVEEGVRRWLLPDQPDSKVMPSLDAIVGQGIKIHACNGFLPGSLRSVGENARHEAVLKFADIAFRRASRVGVKGIVFGSAASRKIRNNFPREKAEAQFVELLRKMAPLAAAQDVEIWIEPLNRKEDNLINTQLQGAAIIEKVGHPSLGLVCDIFHVARNEEPPDSLAKVIRHIKHCHIAEKARRTAPGMEGYDFKPYLKALKSAGYSGTMSMECRWNNMKGQAKRARMYIEKQIAAI